MLILMRGDRFDPNFYYRSKVDVDNSVYIENEEKLLLVSEMNYELAQEKFGNQGKTIKCKHPLEEMKKFCRGKQVGIDFDNINASIYNELACICKLTDISEKLLEKRAIKRKDEVEKISKAVKATKKVFESLDFSGMKTEEDVKNHLLAETAYLGLRPAFEPIVASNKNSRLPHYNDGNGLLEKSVIVDYGVRFQHYCADVTRTFFLSPAKAHEENYSLLKSIFKEVIAEIPKVRTGRQLAEFAKSRLEAYGLPKPIHSIGHGIGLEVHEMPWLRLKSENKIPNKTTMAIEPGAYFKDYGLRFEETIYFDGRKVKTL